MREWNLQCQPPWSEGELRHKVDSADKQPGDRGYLRDAQPTVDGNTLSPALGANTVDVDTTVAAEPLRFMPFPVGALPRRWGLIPSWATDTKIGNSLINARAETVADKPAFRSAFKRHRCLVIADGFYEWRKDGKAKQPFFIRMKDERPFAFAGLAEHWAKGEQPIDSATIITTEPNELMASIHDRMPVILPPDAYELWLDPEFQGRDKLLSLLVSYPADEMIATPVSTIVNSPRNEGPECLTPVEGGDA